MTYYEDLSPYVYWNPVESEKRVRTHFDIPDTEKVVLLNIGWLDDATKPFRTGAVNPQVIDAVAILCDTYHNLMRGYHVCRLCHEATLSYDMMTEFHGGQEIHVGNGEVWFRGLPRSEEPNTTGVYMAPTMLLHYLKKHTYLPPDEALNALLALRP